MNTALHQDDIPLGAHLVTERRGYFHHGIYIGAGRVVHYAGFCAALHCGPVEEASLERFAGGHGFSVQNEPCARYTGAQAVQRALSRLGEDHYRLLTNNCEHFCAWCVHGISRSQQVESCLHHPALGVQIAARLVMAFLRAGRMGMHCGLRAA